MRLSKILTFIWTFAVLLAVATLAAAQSVPTDPGQIIDVIRNADTWEAIISVETGLYMLLITIGGYLSAFIPGLKKISSNTYRVFTFAILLVLGAAIVGKSIWIPAIAYFFSTSLYELVFKWIFPTPKPEPEA